MAKTTGSKHLAYRHSNGPQTTTIERHLKGRHADAWELACREADLQQKVPRVKLAMNDPQKETFTLEGMMQYLLTWIVVDDQVCSRTLLLWLLLMIL
jgi:hypothetical protein